MLLRKPNLFLVYWGATVPDKLSTPTPPAWQNQVIRGYPLSVIPNGPPIFPLKAQPQQPQPNQPNQAMTQAQAMVAAQAQAQQAQMRNIAAGGNMPGRQPGTPVQRNVVPQNLTPQMQQRAPVGNNTMQPPKQADILAFPPFPKMPEDDPSEGPSSRLQATTRYQRNHELMNMVFDPLTTSDILQQLVPKLPLPPSYAPKKEEGYSLQEDREGLQKKLAELQGEVQELKSRKAAKVGA
jgi:hypothetical protein